MDRHEAAASPIGYVVSLYPAPSHTFVLREVRGLRRLGLRVVTFSVRAASPTELLSPCDREEASGTESLLPVSASRLVGAHLSLWWRHPLAWLCAANEALRASPPGARAMVWQLLYLAEAVLLFERCRHLGVRRLHAHLANSAADVAWLAARIGHRADPGAGWRWSFTMHGPTELSEVRRFNLRRKVEAADIVVCISDFCRSQLFRLVDEDQWSKLHVVRCGVDTDEFSFVDRRSRCGRPLTVLSVGRLAVDKGHALLLEAAALASSRALPLHFVLAGDGPERNRLEARLRLLGLDDVVEMIGPVGQDRLAELYHDADIFCLPSFAEGLPIVLMEAMSTGLPVVSTNVAGIPELVRHGETGLLVAPGRPDRLVEALETLAGDGDLRHRIGAAARGAVQVEYDLHRNVARLRSKLFDVLDREAAGPARSASVVAT